MEESDLSIAKTIFEDNTISGFIDFEQKLILINKLDASARQRFTIAHELGHWILHQKEIQNKNGSDFILYIKASYIDENNIWEKQANYFIESNFFRLILSCTGIPSLSIAI